MRLGSALRRRQTHGAAFGVPMGTGECGVRREGGRPVPQRPNPNRARAAARPLRAARRRTLLPLARGIRGRGRIGRHRRVHGRDLRPSGRDRHDGGQQGDENSDEDEALHDRALSFRTGPATPGNGRGTAGEPPGPMIDPCRSPNPTGPELTGAGRASEPVPPRLGRPGFQGGRWWRRRG